MLYVLRQKRWHLTCMPSQWQSGLSRLSSFLCKVSGDIMIELTAADGHIFSAYRADPSDTPKGAVVVLPEVFGIDPHIKKVTESFAALGYVALAPALFDRVKKNVELGYDEAGLTEGLELKSRSRDRRRHRRYSGGRQCGQGRWKSRDRRLLLGRLPCLSLR